MMMMNKLTLNDGSSPKFQEYKATVGATSTLVKTYKVMNNFLQSFFDMVHFLLTLESERISFYSER